MMSARADTWVYSVSSSFWRLLAIWASLGFCHLRGGGGPYAAYLIISGREKSVKRVNSFTDEGSLYRKFSFRITDIFAAFGFLILSFVKD